MKNEKRYHGGILLVALLLLSLFSFIFTCTIENYKDTQKFTLVTMDYYTAQMMVEMFLVDINQKAVALQSQGEQEYTSGVLQYTYDQEIITFSVNVNKRNYVIEKKLLID